MMQKIDQHSTVELEMELRWQSAEAAHAEYYYAPKVNMWRDIFPGSLEDTLQGSKKDDQFSCSFMPGELVPPYSEDKVKDIRRDQFRRVNVNGVVLAPRIGRFYPGGLLQGVPGIYPQTLQPFRVVAMHSDTMKVDLNHPLSRYPLRLATRVADLQKTREERGGRCTDWLDEITANGPGMQARWPQTATRFETTAGYLRHDDKQDALFYHSPRLVGHVDRLASSMIRKFYSIHLQNGDTVLDLMSSVQSHLPADYGLQVTGLGLNETEMQQNPALKEFLVHDLNSNLTLPFGNQAFHAVVCSLSIEYLINPREIIREINRVLKPGGTVLISFSNRWFPPKVTRLWTEIHDFERLGMVLDYLIANNGFLDLRTYSSRNWPRPADDSHADEIMNSDPVFVVAGTKKKDFPAQTDGS